MMHKTGTLFDTRPEHNLLGLSVLAHWLVFWWLLAPTDFTSPPPATPSMMVAMLLQTPSPQPVPRVVPRPQRLPTAKSQAAIHEPVVDPVEVTEPVQPQEPSQENATQQAAPTLPAPILPPRFDAAYLNNPVPLYPPAARRLGVQGKVLLRVQVSVEGRATTVELFQSSGSTALDQAAISAVRKWRFVPAKQGAELAAAWVLVPINFKLN
jgi:protein TonB